VKVTSSYASRPDMPTHDHHRHRACAPNAAEPSSPKVAEPLSFNLAGNNGPPPEASDLSRHQQEVTV
jgi:hypothetical protein